jgi:hypothetical protein
MISSVPWCFRNNHPPTHDFFQKYQVCHIEHNHKTDILNNLAEIDIAGSCCILNIKDRLRMFIAMCNAKQSSEHNIIPSDSPNGPPDHLRQQRPASFLAPFAAL